MTTLVFVDTETTGLDPRKDQIIELAAIRMDWHSWTTERFYYQRFRPTVGVNAEAARVNGYTPEAWAGAPHLSARHIAEIMIFAEGARWIGSMPTFDFDFIEEARMALAPSWTWKLASRRLIDVGSLGAPLIFAGLNEKGGLDEICSVLHIADPRAYYENEVGLGNVYRETGGRIGAHTAMGDALRTAKAFRKLMLRAVDSWSTP
jgi:DNA polymerase-3 subunit epsilon